MFQSALLLLGTYIFVQAGNMLLIRIEEFRRNFRELSAENKSKFCQCKKERRYWSLALQKHAALRRDADITAHVNIGHGNMQSATHALRAKSVAGQGFNLTCFEYHITKAFEHYREARMLAEKLQKREKSAPALLLDEAQNCHEAR